MGSFTAFPYGVSSFGMPVVGTFPLVTTGKTWFVSSVLGTDGSGRGQDPSRPAATLAWAVQNLVRANKGDVILLGPGHAENITGAASINMSVADVWVFGCGVGSDRPTFTWGTSTAATITVTAANVRFQNCVFNMNGIDAVVAGIVVTAAYCQFLDSHFLQGDATNQAVLAISLGAGADNFRAQNCTFSSTTAGATAAIQGVVAVDRLVVRDCWFNLDCTAAINNTTTAWTNVLIQSNTFYMLGSGKAAVLVSTTTGVLRDNATFITANIAAGGSLTAAACLKVNNIAQEAAGVASSGVLDPTSAAIT